MDKTQYKKSFLLNIPVDTYESLQKKASLEERTITKVIIEALDKYFQKPKK